MRLLLRASALLAALSLTLFSLASCKKDTDVVREYCEIKITLPKEFTEYDAAESFDAAYTDGRLIVGIQRLSFDAGVEPSQEKRANTEPKITKTVKNNVKKRLKIFVLALILTPHERI